MSICRSNCVNHAIGIVFKNIGNFYKSKHLDKARMFGIVSLSFMQHPRSKIFSI